MAAASNPDADPVKTASTIKALPPSTVRQIGSTQAIVDPISVVKELIDNALDARATSIFVFISANTIDSIEVKDNGHGILADDRPLVCRRYCTSKIRNFDDLKEVGCKWLGFRGEAMASMAEMSGRLEIMTRVEGEPVAALLKIGRDGEVESTERASHPVGTTVKLTDFFKLLPVRKQSALKHSSKYLSQVKRVIQSYALARPTVRFSLQVRKAKTDKGNWVYAPKAGANAEDAAFKAIGRECASQCNWTAIESDGFEIQAFLPRADAVGAKISSEGAFISIDARPVSATRGTLKKIVAIFKERLRKSNPALASTKDPFMCMSINCPPHSYDPNIEPAKDDVLFEDGEAVLGAIDRLLTSIRSLGGREHWERDLHAQKHNAIQVEVEHVWCR
ncbi:histidine kinase-like ATPase [Clohesyomyces aquaticus]|uniref:Histidine kinase-like ATPase n=1 Tax=Clohesyomyces aquaticus TaxID=1231657 RepID=A0A1Y1YPE0_9PLEO|nr:histidine kinase-like ATPase [Clohesyomyces aquaticus]